MTRYPPISSCDWPHELSDMEHGFAGRLNVYRVMAHHPALLLAWSNLREHIVVNTALGAEFSEVVILRAAHWMNSDYEWSHHVIRARALGFDDLRIGSLAGPTEDMNGNDRVIAGAVDALMTARCIPPEMQESLETVIGKNAIFDLMATVGFYSTLGFILNSFPPPLDEDIKTELTKKPFMKG